MGDTFSNISNSTIVNRSLVQGAVTCLRQSNQSASAETLQRLAELVEKSGNNDASEYLNEFTKELQQPAPRNAILRSMWEGIQRILPSITNILEITEGIERLI